MPTLEMLFEVEAERNKLLVERNQRTIEAQTLYDKLKLLVKHFDASEKMLQQVYGVPSGWQASMTREEFLATLQRYKHLDVKEKPAEGEVTHV